MKQQMLPLLLLTEFFVYILIYLIISLPSNELKVKFYVSSCTFFWLSLEQSVTLDNV